MTKSGDGGHVQRFGRHCHEALAAGDGVVFRFRTVGQPYGIRAGLNAVVGVSREYGQQIEGLLQCLAVYETLLRVSVGGGVPVAVDFFHIRRCQCQRGFGYLIGKGHADGEGMRSGVGGFGPGRIGAGVLVQLQRAEPERVAGQVVDGEEWFKKQFEKLQQIIHRTVQP